MCRITINAQGVEVDESVRRLVEGSVRAVLEPHGIRVASAHVRLWEGASQGPTTCYIRVDLNPSGGLGRGVTEPDLTKAVRRASERVGTAVQRELAFPTRPAAPRWSRGFRT